MNAERGHDQTALNAAERAVLGAILLDDKELFTVRAILRPDDFEDNDLAYLYRQILEMSDTDQAIDQVTLYRNVANNGRADKISASYIAELTDAIPTTSNLTHYAQIVADEAVRRRLHHGLKKHSVNAMKTQSPRDYILEVMREIEEIGRVAELSGNVSVDDILADYRAEFERSWSERRGIGLRLGITDLDRKVFAGLSNEDHVIVGGRPSHGKTALLLSLAYGWAKAGHRVFIGSTETTRMKLLARLNQIACPNQLYLDALHDSNRRRRLLHTYQSELKSLPIHFQDSTLYIEDMSYMVRAHCHRYPDTAVVAFDYLQLFRTRQKGLDPGSPAYLAHILSEIKALQKNIKRPVVTMSQLNRMEVDDNKGPGEWHFKGTGNIEQDADVLIALYVQKEYQGEDSQGQPIRDCPLMAKVLKQRDGPTGTVWLRFCKPQTLVMSPNGRDTDAQATQPQIWGPDKDPYKEEETDDDDLF